MKAHAAPQCQPLEPGEPVSLAFGHYQAEEPLARGAGRSVWRGRDTHLDRDVVIELSDPARAWIAEKGYDKVFGARQLARFIQEHLKMPLAEELLFGKLTDGGTARVEFDDGKLSFSYAASSRRPPRKKRKPKRKPTVPALVE